MLVLLEGQGLVQRGPHPTDARARTVALTATGQRKFRQLWTAGEPIREQMVDALQPHEAETLVKLLTRVAESLTAEYPSPGRETLPLTEPHTEEVKS
jgi:DNA-binding MarR family transcriptional regulator